MQDAVSENMPAFGVCPQLRFVNCDEGKFPVDGHAFNRAAIPAGLWWLDPFLARNQRDILRALNRHQPVIDFPRQQPQRKADHPARMGTHPLHSEMGLAGVRWT